MSRETLKDGALVGERITYRLRRVHEVVGDLVVPLDVIASIDEALDDLCALEGDLGAAEVLRLTPYFGTLWPSARALARWLAAHETWLAGQVVLELGCGLALPSLVAVRLGARVIATDRHADVVPLLARNAALSPAAPTYRTLDWTDPAQTRQLAAELGHIDLVIASDILYEAEIVDALVPALTHLCSPTTRVVISDPGRPHLQAAVNRIERSGFKSELEISPVPGDVDDAAVGTTKSREIFVVTFVRAEPQSRQ